jgi:hypothetical protein
VTERIEGLLVLEGLVEGRLPAEPGVAQGSFVPPLRDWVRAPAELGLRFELAVEGGTFSLLADHVVLPTLRLGSDPAARIRASLAELVGTFPSAAEAGLFSTVRSTRYEPGREIQTVYLIRPDGTVEAAERSLAVQTRPPPPAPGAVRRRVLLSVFALFALLLLGSTLFVDWPEVLREGWNRAVPFDAASVEVDAGPFAPFLSVAARERGPGGQSLRLTLRRTEAWPRGRDQIHALAGQAGEDVVSRLVVEALARGYVLLERFDGGGRFLGVGLARVRDLATAETVVVEVPVARGRIPARVLLVP